jgi:DNA-binding MarR family transcriptional regulator
MMNKKNTSLKQRILSALQAKPLSYMQLAEILNAKPHTVRARLHELCKDGLIKRVGDGLYAKNQLQKNEQKDTEIKFSNKIKGSGEKILISPVGLLKKIAEGKYPKQIASELNISNSRLHYYIRLLREKGYIQRRVRSNIVIYELTEKGEKILEVKDRAAGEHLIDLPRSKGKTTSIDQFTKPIGKLHAFCIAYEIVKDNPTFLPIEEGFKMGGGIVRVVGKERLDKEYTIERYHTPSKDWLYVYSSEKYGSSESEMIAKACIECDRVAFEVARRHNLILGEYKIVKPGEISFKDPFAELYKRNGGPNVKVGDWGWIDDSEKIGEIEFRAGKGIAQAYIELPERLARLEKSMETLTKTIEAHESRLEALTQSGLAVNKRLEHMEYAFIGLGEVLRRIGDYFDERKLGIVGRLKRWLFGSK